MSCREFALRTSDSKTVSVEQFRRQWDLAAMYSLVPSNGWAEHAAVDGALLPLHLLHHRIPLGEFFLEIAVRALRPKAEHRLESGLDEFLLKPLVCPRRLGEVVELFEHWLWRAGGREYAKEDLRNEIRQPFLDRGRNIRRRVEPRRRVHRQHANLAGAVQRNHLRGDVGENDGDLSAQEVVHRRRHASVGYMQDVEAGALLEQFRCDVGDRADAP